jgi:hypothetical protein
VEPASGTALKVPAKAREGAKTAVANSTKANFIIIPQGLMELAAEKDEPG